MNYDDEAPFEVSRYREMQKALPGADGLYALLRAHVEVARPHGGAVLVVGAGGGREVEALAASPLGFEVTGVDPSGDMLEIAAWYAERSGHGERVQLIQGLIGDVTAPEGGFDVGTSMLVMHFLPDDDSAGGKLAFLRAIRERLAPDALLVHADVSFGPRPEAVEPVFTQHARFMGLPEAVVNGAPKMMATMPIIGPERTAELIEAAGFSRPSAFFQALWYRAWTARAI